MEPLVSVNCKTYNHAPYIKDTLNGFVKQNTNFPFEVLIHDDASTDGTQDILRDYERDRPDIFRVIYEKENQRSKGVKINKTYQLSRAKGKYIAFCDGGDYWFHPNKLQRQVDYMESHKECVLAFHASLWIKDVLGDTQIIKANQKWFQEVDLNADLVVKAGAACFDNVSLVSRSDITKRCPKFMETVDTEGYPLLFLLATEGYFHYFPDAMAAYRVSPDKSRREIYSAGHCLNAIKWLYEYNIYLNGKFSTEIGKIMYDYALELINIDVIENYPAIKSILDKSEEKSKKMKKIETIIKVFKDESKIEKFHEAENEYYAWFVEAMGNETAKNHKIGDVIYPEKICIH